MPSVSRFGEANEKWDFSPDKDLKSFFSMSEVLKKLMTAGVVDCFRVADPSDNHLQNYPPRAAVSLTPF